MLNEERVYDVKIPTGFYGFYLYYLGLSEKERENQGLPPLNEKEKEAVEKMKAYADELKKLPKSKHDEGFDAIALALSPNRTSVSKFKEYKDVKVDIPVKNYFDKPEIQHISNRLGKDIEKEMTDFGNKNGFPVIFVFCPFKSEMKDGICKCSSEVKFFKADETEEAVSFARLNGTECVGKFVPYQKLDEIR